MIVGKYIDCGLCGATGRNDQGKICFLCNGSGEVEDFEEVLDQLKEEIKS